MVLFDIKFSKEKNNLEIHNKKTKEVILSDANFGIIYKKNGNIINTIDASFEKKFKIDNGKLKLRKINGDLETNFHIILGTDESIELFLSVKNKTNKKITLINSVLLEGYLALCKKFNNWKFFEHGWNTVSQSKYKKISDKSKKSIVLSRNYNINSFNKDYGSLGNEIVSEMFSLAVDKTNDLCLLMGATTTKKQYSQVYWYLDDFPKFRLTSQMDEVTLEKNEEISTEIFLICFGEKSEVLKLYSKKVAEKMNPPIPEKNYSGWCSWYYYSNDISEKIILRELKVVSKIKQKIPFKYFLVDDGYCITGDWLEYHKVFPNGMKFLADEIKKQKLSPGIWLTPYLIDRKSKVYKKHQDWILLNKKGNPVFCTKITFNPLIGFEKWNKYTLDPTHPEVKKWITHVIDTVVNEWGYELLKLDFLHSLSMSDSYYQKNITRAQALRIGIETIRKTAGNKVHITGAITPLSPTIGIFNSMRISGDIISPPLAHLPIINRIINKFTFQNNFRNITYRKFMHKNFWLNDPDCLVVRSRLKLDKNIFNKYYNMIKNSDYQIFLGD